MEEDFRPTERVVSLTPAPLVHPEYRGLLEQMQLRGVYFSRAGRSQFVAFNLVLLRISYWTLAPGRPV